MRIAMTDQEVLDAIGREFGTCPRPEHFTNYGHCCECWEHDELLRSRNRDTLCVEDVGNPGWDPICFITPEGFAYYAPALARLALAEPDPTRGTYVPQLAFHLRYDGAQNVRWQHCTAGQRKAVVALLEHMIETRAALIDESCCADMVVEALAVWSGAAPPN
jgi:hypothetical protein